MGLLSEFFQFMSSVVLGRKYASQEFREALSMGERYIRWGNERGDIRDYASAMEQLDRCNDEDAPRAEFVVRKYNALLTAVSSTFEYRLKKYKELCAKLDAANMGMRREQETLADQIVVARKRIDSLKAEGSLIKAKEEERHIEELKARKASLENKLNSGQSDEELAGAYDKFVAETETLCQDLEARMIGLETAGNIAPGALGPLSKQIQDRINSIRLSLKELAPSGNDSEVLTQEEG